MKKLSKLVFLSILLAGVAAAGCYEGSGTTGDAPLDDAHGADGDAAEQGTDVVPDVPPDWPDLPYDYPPDYPVDRPVDYPPELVTDYPIDWPPDTTCIQEGCSVSSGGMCCSGLTAASECDPSGGDPSCTMMFCLRVGDGTCGAHENCYNSLTDCRMPSCEPGTGMGYSCGMMESHNCTCTGGDCRPVCMADSSGARGWLDPCSGAMIRADDCRGQTAVCGQLCTRSEGWYESATGELIEWAWCGYRWDCEVVW
jgi:hypothetical protein